jgi:3-oxoacyl-[acyl-carrier protein] reductase
MQELHREPKLKGQVALVSGAGRGLGRAYAHRLSARVAVLDLSLKSYADFPVEHEAIKGDSTVAEIEACGGEAIGLEVDATDSVEVNRAVEQIIRHWGRLDVAVCNAGGGMETLTETTSTLVSDAHLDAVVQRNFRGTVNTCRAAAIPMKAQCAGRPPSRGWPGRIAEPTGGYAHYGAAKAAIIVYT